MATRTEVYVLLRFEMDFTQKKTVCFQEMQHVCIHVYIQLSQCLINYKRQPLAFGSKDESY